VAHPKGFWDPFRYSNLTHKGILAGKSTGNVSSGCLSPASNLP